MDQRESRYSDFHTIDWLRDIAKDRLRHRTIIKKRKGSLTEKIKSWIDAASGWLCVFLVGVSVGTIAGNLKKLVLICLELACSKILKYCFSES